MLVLVDLGLSDLLLFLGVLFNVDGGGVFFALFLLCFFGGRDGLLAGFWLVLEVTDHTVGQRGGT